MHLSVPEAFFLRALLRASPWLPADASWQYRFGKYTLDAAIPSLAADMEVDGYLHSLESGRRHDAERTAFLEGCGWRMFRFTADDVCDSVEHYVKDDRFYPGYKADRCVWALLTALGLPAPEPHELLKPQKVEPILMAGKTFGRGANKPPFHADKWPGVNGW